MTRAGMARSAECVLCEPTETAMSARMDNPEENHWRVADPYAPPEFEAPWIGRPHVIALTLDRLARREISAMRTASPAIGRCQKAQARTLSSAPTAFPLFVEEMTKTVLDSDSQRCHRSHQSVFSAAVKPR
jgi:hypothetical protein